ncbi:endonuclease [Mycobacterium sp. ITM-2017-0098]|nr:endonuclease [Mycobacterium sp. ITM-2017-0098]
MTLATYNVWFNELHAQQRYRAITDILSRELPDVMVFQEVTDSALEVFLAQPWIRSRYYRVAVVGDRVGNYGMLMLSRLPIRRATYTQLPTKLSRGYLSADFTINGVDQKMVSVHLESGKNARHLRARQLSSLSRAFRTDDNVVLLGDFNMRDDEDHLLDPHYRDVWPTLRPEEPGFTEDTSINHMRYDMKDKHRHVRFDRVLVKGSAWTPDSIELLGREPIAPSLPRIFPSDHFGVVCRLVAQRPGGLANPTLRTGVARS